MPILSSESSLSGVDGSLLASEARLTELVIGIQAGNETATEELYQLIRPGLRWFLVRKLDSTDDTLDGIQQVFLILIQNIRKGKLRKPESLRAYIRAIAVRYTARVIRRRILERRQLTDVDYFSLADARPTPERSLIAQQQIDRMKQVLSELSAKAREVLERFYLLEQSPEQICEEMGLTSTQFRLLKSRAKARCAKLGQREDHRVFTAWQPGSRTESPEKCRRTSRSEPALIISKV